MPHNCTSLQCNINCSNVQPAKMSFSFSGSPYTCPNNILWGWQWTEKIIPYQSLPRRNYEMHYYHNFSGCMYVFMCAMYVPQAYAINANNQSPWKLVEHQKPIPQCWMLLAELNLMLTLVVAMAKQELMYWLHTHYCYKKQTVETISEAAFWDLMWIPDPSSRTRWEAWKIEVLDPQLSTFTEKLPNIIHKPVFYSILIFCHLLIHVHFCLVRWFYFFFKPFSQLLMFTFSGDMIFHFSPFSHSFIFTFFWRYGFSLFQHFSFMFTVFHAFQTQFITRLINCKEVLTFCT